MFGEAGFAARVKTRPQRILANVFELLGANGFFVDRADLLLNFKRAVATHEFQRRQIFRRGFLRQTRNRVVKNPLVVFIDAKPRARILFRLDILANAELSRRDRCARLVPAKTRFLPKLRRDSLRECR